MIPLTKGKYTVRAACGAQDMDKVLALRRLCFGPAGGVVDAFDDPSTQIVVWSGDELVAAFRINVMHAAALPRSYAAQYYGLGPLQKAKGPLLELGRFCIHPGHTDPDILRIAWAALTAVVDAQGITMLFGCASFEGTQTAPYADAFALLKARHLAPEGLMPLRRAAEVYPYADEVCCKPDLARAQAAMPPLLRTYLMMGGWVSDHAVIDPAMGTLHVFCAVQIDAIPPARKKLLRALV